MTAPAERLQKRIESTKLKIYMIKQPLFKNTLEFQRIMILKNRLTK